MVERKREEGEPRMNDLGALFRIQVSKDPDGVAITRAGVSLTFRDLAQLTEEAAGRLKIDFVEARCDYLPLVVDNSVDSYIAVLACLIHRIPFGLIDGSAPRQRIDVLLSLFGNPERGWWGPKVGRDSIPSVWREELTPSQKTGSGNSIPEAGPTMFVVTTSGSTGAPKGVILSSERLVQGLVRTERDEFPVEQASLSSFSPLHFIGGLNRLASVFLGRQLHVFDPMEMSAGQILIALGEARLSHLQVPPQLGRLLAHYSNPAEVFLNTVTHLRMGSEGIRFEILEGLKRYLDASVIFWHGLGATEAMGIIRGKQVLKDLPSTGQVPLGHLQPGARLIATDGFDSNIREVWASSNIALGYLGQPELTAERFVTGEDGIRYWRSGDLVERTEDGNLYHRGRIDDVVKVRGILASPSETTRFLLGIPGVRAGVTLPATKDGNTRLVSHVELSSGGSSLSVADLRSALEKALPSHLLPAEITIHERLPTNPRGKIDRMALKARTRF
jgi:acyl-coenzyme A synthetase/AMP-(fatty) acid ligase